MISFFLFVCLFTFVTCKAFHPNQHLPVQKYQPPLRYRPPYDYTYYPSAPTASIYRPPSPTKQGIDETNEEQELTDLERQYQQWQIAVSNGQQPGVVWISAPQYSYYPPPSGSPSNYPPPPYYPAPFPTYPSQPVLLNQTRPEIQEINPTLSRETVNPSPPTPPDLPTSSVFGSTTPSENITLSPIETVPTRPSEPPSTFSPFTESTTVSIENSTFIFTTTPVENVTTTESATNATELPTTASPTTFVPSTFIPSSTSWSTSWSTSSSTPPSTYPPTTTYAPSNNTQNVTSTETTTAPQNTTSNSTNPLLKYCKKPRGQFPGRDCNKFVNCWDDTAVEQVCPSGLYFNANKSYCDYPENVECSGASSTESSTTSSSSPANTTSSKCPSSYGTYRNSSNCAAFYVCVAWEPVNFYCPPGTNYNDELKVCDYPYRVNCSGIPSYPIPEESVTTIATETTPNSTNSTSSSNTTTPYTTESPANVTAPSNVTSSPNTITSSPNTTTNSPNTTTSSPTTVSSTTSSPNTTVRVTTESINVTTETFSTIPPPQVTEEPLPTLPPPSVDPVALYNYNLKKLPESVVNTGVRCYHSNIFRLTPDCSSVTVCQDGLTYIVNCGHATSFDAYSQKCVPTFRARC